MAEIVGAKRVAFRNAYFPGGFLVVLQSHGVLQFYVIDAEAGVKKSETWADLEGNFASGNVQNS